MLFFFFLNLANFILETFLLPFRKSIGHVVVQAVRKNRRYNQH